MAYNIRDCANELEAAIVIPTALKDGDKDDAEPPPPPPEPPPPSDDFGMEIRGGGGWPALRQAGDESRTVRLKDWEIARMAQHFLDEIDERERGIGDVREIEMYRRGLQVLYAAQENAK